MLEDATWARLAMAMSALKGFEEDNNMLKKSTLSLNTVSFQTKPARNFSALVGSFVQTMKLKQQQ